MIDLFADIIMWIWQLPQNLLGFVISLFCEYDKEKKVYWCGKLFRSGVSLGNYIIFDSRLKDIDNQRFVKMNLHEIGHQNQSYLLGWLYLVVIGLPSLVWNVLHRWFFKDKDYYSFYTEKWADKLGGVKCDT